MGSTKIFFQNLSVNSLKHDQYNDTTYNPPIFSLDNAFKRIIDFYIHACLPSRPLGRYCMYYHVRRNVIIWIEYYHLEIMLSFGEMLWCGAKCYPGMKCYNLGWNDINCMGWNVIICSQWYHLAQMLSCGTKCYHVKANAAIWSILCC